VFTPAVVLLSSGSSLPGPRPQLVRVLLPPARRGAASSPSPSLPAQAEVTKRRKPQWGWWLRVRDSPAWRPFEARPRAARGGLPPVPLAVRQAGQVAPVAAARSHLGCARCGGNRVIAYPAVDSDPNAHTPVLGVRAAWLARPSRRAPWRDAARLTGRWEKARKMGMKGG
jgi:hypothetical protein